ncbi:MAG TPA: hypothetical protein VE135_20860 [Pyrinomonadaceae bacterium]|nr:hypothetical protein [Pyrinomonadaceae bacterium]
MKACKFFAVNMILISIALQGFAKTSSGGRRIDVRTSLFAYDRSRPFELKELSKQERQGVTISDVEYAPYTAKRGRIKAFLVRPAGNGPFAGVLFFHWLGRPNGDRTQFVEEAVSLARQGTVSLLIQGYFPWQVDPVDGPTDRQLIVDETIEARRALDLLTSQTTVDRTRVGYVGHDYGAMYGSLLAGVEKRVKTYVLIAGIGSFTDWSLEYWLKAKPDDFKKQYGEAMLAVEPLTTIKRAAPAPLLFQFANMDTYISRHAAMAFYSAASRPKQIKWYHTTHEMNIEEARIDRRAWLTQRLRLVRNKT